MKVVQLRLTIALGVLSVSFQAHALEPTPVSDAGGAVGIYFLPKTSKSEQLPRGSGSRETRCWEKYMSDCRECDAGYGDTPMGAICKSQAHTAYRICLGYNHLE